MILLREVRPDIKTGTSLCSDRVLHLTLSTTMSLDVKVKLG